MVQGFQVLLLHEHNKRYFEVSKGNNLLISGERSLSLV